MQEQNAPDWTNGATVEELEAYYEAANEIYEIQSPPPVFNTNASSCVMMIKLRRKDGMPLTVDEVPRFLMLSGYRMLKMLKKQRGDT